MELGSIEIDVEAYVVDDDGPSWVPAVFRRNDVPSKDDGLVAIRIDVAEGHPWHAENGKTFMVHRSEVYRRRPEAEA